MHIYGNIAARLIRSMQVVDQLYSGQLKSTKIKEIIVGADVLLNVFVTQDLIFPLFLIKKLSRPKFM
jgi:hypothetical protein